MVNHERVRRSRGAPESRGVRRAHIVSSTVSMAKAASACMHGVREPARSTGLTKLFVLAGS